MLRGLDQIKGYISGLEAKWKEGEYIVVEIHYDSESRVVFDRAIYIGENLLIASEIMLSLMKSKSRDENIWILKPSVASDGSAYATQVNWTWVYGELKEQGLTDD